MQPGEEDQLLGERDLGGGGHEGEGRNQDQKRYPEGSKTLEFGKPDMMKMVLPGNPEAGLEMPLKFYVYERADGKAVVSYYKPSGGFASYGKEQLTKVGQMMDAMLDEIVAEATR